MKFIKATSGHSKDLADLAIQLGYPSTEKEILERLDSIFRANDHLVIAAIQNENVVGWIHAFIAYRLESDPFVEIGGLVVDDKLRSQGIGSSLVKEIKSWAAENNCSKIRVRTNSKRKDAPKFYKKLGFEKVKEQLIMDLEV